MTAKGWTVVLSGGGAKAAAHLGAVEVLRDEGIRPDRFVATSMGAVLAAALASGLSTREVGERLASVSRSDVAQVSPVSLVRGWLARALLRGEPLHRTISRLIPAKRFADLVIPLSVTATDLDSGQQVVFGAGGEDAPLEEALYASCALPVWYPPSHMGGRRLADGGLRGAVPLRVAAQFPAQGVIAVDVGPGFDTGPRHGKDRAPPLLKVHSDASRIMMAGLTELELAWWAGQPTLPPLWYVRPTVPSGATFALSDLTKFIEEGRRSMRAKLPLDLGADTDRL